MTDNTFTVGDATITSVGKVTNRARLKFNRIRRLTTTQRGDDSADFAYLTAYTAKATGGDWTPVNPDSDDATLLKSYDEWLNFDAKLNDEWWVGLFPSTPDPITSPDPLPDTADPNS